MITTTIFRQLIKLLMIIWEKSCLKNYLRNTANSNQKTKKIPFPAICRFCELSNKEKYDMERFIMSGAKDEENNKYIGTKLHVEDKICIEIKSGKAYYTNINYIYKLSEEKSIWFNKWY